MSINERLGQLEDNLAGLEAQLNERIDGLVNNLPRLEQLEAKVSALELLNLPVKEQGKTLEMLARRTEVHGQKLETLEEDKRKLATELLNVEAKSATWEAVNSDNHRLNELERLVAGFDPKLADIEERWRGDDKAAWSTLESHDTRLGKLEQQLARLVVEQSSPDGRSTDSALPPEARSIFELEQRIDAIKDLVVDLARQLQRTRMNHSPMPTPDSIFGRLEHSLQQLDDAKGKLAVQMEMLNKWTRAELEGR